MGNDEVRAMCDRYRMARVEVERLRAEVVRLRLALATEKWATKKLDEFRIEQDREIERLRRELAMWVAAVPPRQDVDP